MRLVDSYFVGCVDRVVSVVFSHFELKIRNIFLGKKLRRTVNDIFEGARCHIWTCKCHLVLVFGFDTICLIFETREKKIPHTFVDSYESFSRLRTSLMLVYDFFVHMRRYHKLVGISNGCKAKNRISPDAKRKRTENPISICICTQEPTDSESDFPRPRHCLIDQMLHTGSRETARESFASIGH